LPFYLRTTPALALPKIEFTVTSFGSSPKSATICVSVHEMMLAVTDFVTALRPLPLVMVPVTEVDEPLAYAPNPLPDMVILPR
jgi:hypothetical protein